VRLFIGIPVKFEEWLQRVYSRVEALRADIKMVEPKNVHITLAFLGEVREEKVDLVKESMKEVKFSTFSLTFKGLGAFPSLSRPRVIWVGISNGFNDLKTLRTSLVKSLAARGVRPEDGQFQPHLTIGRVKGPKGVLELMKLIEEMLDIPLGEQEVREVTLFKSVLTPKGPIYEELASIQAH
jgi:2'-5' RNA ligase